MHAPTDRDTPTLPGSRAGRGRRGALAAALGLAVLALHALVLQGLAGLGGGLDDAVRPVTAALQVRSVAPPGVPVEPAERPGPAAPEATAPVPAVAAPVGRPAAATATVADLAADVAAVPPVPPPAVAPPPEPAASVATGPVAAAVPVADTAASAAASPASAPDTAGAAPPDAGGEVLPLYAAQLPPAATLDYVLRRGLLSGSGRLSWSPAADGGYEARLEGGAFGQTLLAQVSRGQVGPHGLAPERFTDRRRGRGEQAANFQREAGRISFSGPGVTYPLHPGAQDRVSWLVQLGAVLAADPALQRPGAAVKLFVAGARGDADVWTFVVQGRQALALPGRPPTEALHVLRAPRRAFDTLAEAWLDPARGFLPVRVRLATPDSGDETELLLAPD